MDNMNTKCVRTPASIQQVMSPIWKRWCIGDFAESAPGHPSGGAHQQLPRDRGQRQADGAAAAGATAAGPGGTDPEGTELPEGENSERFFFCMTAVLPRCSVQTLFMTCFFFVRPTVSWGALSHDQREHEPASPLVVHRADTHSHCDGHLADETSQELLWGQETGVKRVHRQHVKQHFLLEYKWSYCHIRFYTHAHKHRFWFDGLTSARQELNISTS